MRGLTDCGVSREASLSAKPKLGRKIVFCVGAAGVVAVGGIWAAVLAGGQNPQRVALTNSAGPASASSAISVPPPIPGTIPPRPPSNSSGTTVPAGAAAKPTTSTTSTPPGPPPPTGWVPPPPPPPSQQNPVQATPGVVIPSNPCTNSAISASITSFGPHLGMGLVQDVVTLSSAQPCYVNGYPTISFGSPTIKISVTDGGSGQASTPAPVRVDQGSSASFVVQFTAGRASGQCPSTSVFAMGVPASTPTVLVSLAPMNGQQFGFSICGKVTVTPFEQGNSPDIYA
jgi:hypothetical protein